VISRNNKEFNMLSDKIKSITMTKNELENDPRYDRDDYLTGIANGLSVALQILAREEEHKFIASFEHRADGDVVT